MAPTRTAFAALTGGSAALGAALRKAAMPHLLLIVATLALAACGFQLRGAYALPFDTLHIALPDSTSLHAVLKRNIEAASQTRVVADPKSAQATLAVVADVPQKVVLSLDSAGRVREYRLVRTFSFRIVDTADHELIPVSTVVIRRDITFNDVQVLSKESEEALLWRDIETDLVQQLLRRLAAAKAVAANK